MRQPGTLCFSNCLLSQSSMRAYMAFEDDYHHASTSGMVGLQGRETSGTNTLHRIRCSTQGEEDFENLLLHPGTYDVLLLLQDLREELL